MEQAAEQKKTTKYHAEDMILDRRFPVKYQIAVWGPKLGDV